MNYEDALCGLGVTLPDIIGQYSIECSRFIPVRANCQKAKRLDYNQYVTVFVKYADIFWQVLIARA